jgi:hypothetical protein
VMAAWAVMAVRGAEPSVERSAAAVLTPKRIPSRRASELFTLG